MTVKETIILFNEGEETTEIYIFRKSVNSIMIYLELSKMVSTDANRCQFSVLTHEMPHKQPKHKVLTDNNERYLNKSVIAVVRKGIGDIENVLVYTSPLLSR